MKRLIFFIVQLSIFNFLMGCQREADLPEATSAAKEVYLQYADCKDLTVAMIGDYQGYNAVMLQAQDAEGWLRLCGEFGVGKSVDATALDSVKVSSLNHASFSADTFRFSGNPDTFQFPSTIGEFFTDLLDSVAVSETGRLLWDTAYTVTRHEHWENGQLVDEGRDTVTGDAARQMLRPNDRLFRTATEHGHRGYLIHDDSRSLTLWLFFYSTKAELSQIINTITLIH
jgi:hypothetical protein